MELIKSYFTRKGWSEDLKKTTERHPKLTRSVKQIVNFAIDSFYEITTPIGVKKLIQDMKSEHYYLMRKLGYKRPENFIGYLLREQALREEGLKPLTLEYKLD